MHGGDHMSALVHTKTTETEKIVSSEFLNLFGSTIEDGFFGGVKWGIAAAFYHLLYNVMGLAVFTLPKVATSLSHMYTQWRDKHLGRAPLLEIHELQVLVSLLSEALKEYEAVDLRLGTVHECSALPTGTLSMVIRHIYDYVKLRSERYENSFADKEILFFLRLIADTIDGILNCIECATYRSEIIITVKTTIIIINKLIILLQGPDFDKKYDDPAIAWFSGKGKWYALYY